MKEKGPYNNNINNKTYINDIYFIFIGVVRNVYVLK